MVKSCAVILLAVLRTSLALMLMFLPLSIKVGKGNVLMRNLKDLVGTEDFLHRLELTFHQFLHLINFAKNITF
jgi:hypothetical protein